MTFADLMSLLLAFFVLLFSFSELDLQKYKRIAGSMKAAFGVQREVPVKVSPKGTSIIAQEFSPGAVTPTAIPQVRQSTTEIERRSPKVVSKKRQQRRRNEDVKRLQAALAQFLKEGVAELDKTGNTVILRLKDQGLFESGGIEISAKYQVLLERLGKAMTRSDGTFVISGHTDNLPILTDRFRSNWDLSTARAVSVVDALLEYSGLPGSRFEASGFADTRPLTDNATEEGRMENRRVEITIKYDQESDGPEDEPVPKLGDLHIGLAGAVSEGEELP